MSRIFHKSTRGPVVGIVTDAVYQAARESMTPMTQIFVFHPEAHARPQENLRPRKVYTGTHAEMRELLYDCEVIDHGDEFPVPFSEGTDPASNTQWPEATLKGVTNMNLAIEAFGPKAIRVLR